MALEMFAGKTGDRLIARLPVADGSYADVEVTTPQHQRVTVQLSYEGNQINGYPALSPTIDSLKDAIGQLAAVIPTKRQAYNQEADELEQLVEKIASARQQANDPFGTLPALFLQWKAEDRAAYLRKLGPKVPICPRVILGQMLQLRLPVMYGKVSALDLGKVERINIYNA